MAYFLTPSKGAKMQRFWISEFMLSSGTVRLVLPGAGPHRDHELRNL